LIAHQFDLSVVVIGHGGIRARNKKGLRLLEQAKTLRESHEEIETPSVGRCPSLGMPIGILGRTIAAFIALLGLKHFDDF
jgi:hypothetical protein